ncbi:dmX-like protein 2 isoform X2 [Aphidius gifuensis]|uniref:dmX-like protein 2 isoform X2 n=1 Tax=Aphidius gifuensis TaxID=684658 RepID=UPI001CDCECB6|nr:dmX-like protein 2 isoform X2 [Aphidius gifuensis]
MNCHQILSGACNAGDRCYAVGSVEGISFTAYAAGCNIVILASNFERVQIIPGAVHNYIRISCLDCSTDTGKIAAAYENQICIFEPTPLIHTTCSHQLEYRWVQTGSLQTEFHITSLSWNLEGTRLLTGGELLQLWHQNIQPFHDDHPTVVTFSIGGEAESPLPNDTNPMNEPGGWNCVWKCRTATPVHLMSFSPDGTLFATTGLNDRLVKIWFENKNLFPLRGVDHHGCFGTSIPNDSYSFVYIAHPRAVTHLSWRKTSKYMPKGSVSNMLVTSCRDNICRVWAETIPPEIEGLANMSQFEGSDRHHHHGKRHHSMHKHRFMQRLKHMKTCFHIRRHAKQQHQAGHSAPTLPTLPSTYSVHDFHNNYQSTGGHFPGMHFHLAASINAETDIPLVPSLITDDPEREPNFILHWLNNKEMHFTMQAENILQELTRKVVEKEEGLHNNNHHHETDHVEHDSEDEHTPKKSSRHQNSAKRTTSQDDHSSDEHHTPHTGSSHHSLPYSVHSHASLSNTTSINSIATDAASSINHGPDSLDTKIETLLRDWHHNPDLLFSIHPIDGSFLIWHVEWLDEYHPGSFRQAQISFSTRIPNAFPLGDASTMSHNVSMYSHNTGGPLLSIREVAKSSAKSNEHNEILTPLPSVIEQDEDQSTLTSKAGQEFIQSVRNYTDQKQNNASMQNNTSGGGAGNAANNAADISKNNQDVVNDFLAHPSPIVSMVSKHSNGTLNLWQLTFADKTKFSQVLSIGHACRASGHRFRVNDITCHPVLPLLVTTSHHNIPEFNPNNSDVSNDNDNVNNNDNNNCQNNNNNNDNNNLRNKEIMSATGFCSELILWRVDAVGPLSKSGGVSELARINSPEISAFSNVAWIPTLLPSTTLGNLSNSPSACFVASDGQCLRVYQAVIDARTLLAEVSISERRSRMMDSMASISTDISSDDGIRHSIHDRIKIVSQQSTARPGCVIQLDAISDATHDWQNTQFLHVFQEQLITGERNDEKLPGIDTTANDLGLMESTLDAMVDLQQSSIFEEPFYIVVLERTQKGTTVHMWRLVIASQPETNGLTGSMMYVPDSHLVQDDDDDGTPGRSGFEGRRSRRQSQSGIGINTSTNTNTNTNTTNSNTNANANTGRSRRSSQADFDQSYLHRRHHNSHVLITTTKVCTQELPLPDGVEVVHAAPAAGHLSSSSIYPACFAPYIVVTACSDSTVRFWKCNVTKNNKNNSEKVEEEKEKDDVLSYEWKEWEMIRKDQESTIDISGQPLNISAAYSGRIACAYKYGKSFTRPTKSDPDSRYVNLCVAIYECESTGGSEWILEDTIHLKNIHLPRIQVDQHLDLSYLYDSRYLQKKQRLTQVLQTLSHEDIRSPRNGGNGGSLGVNGGNGINDTNENSKTNAGLLAVPSFSTLQSLRKSIIENGNTCPLTQKHLVQLDWVSKEDGSHILTVGVGSKIMLFTPVCSDLAQANMKAMKESQTNNRPILRKTSSLAQPQFVDEIRWMKLRKINLTTADGLPPLPMQISWVRDGILVVGMDSEMHVYSQWKPNPKNDCTSSSSLQHQESDEFQASRNLRDEDLRTLAHETSQRRLANVSSMPHLSRVSSINLTMLDAKKKRCMQNNDIVNFDYMPDYGLFEASRIACPVLPQYHPKQLMELLNSGKIRWVKAILSHLVRCITSSCSIRADDESLMKQRGTWTRSRTMSVTYAGTTSPLESRGSTTQIPEELTLDYAEITSIPPLPLWTLLIADKETNTTQLQNDDNKQDYNVLFDGNVDEGESLDDMLDENYDCKRQKDRRSSVPERQGISHFGPRQGRLLSRLLTHTHLPGLSSLDQMHLLALADTVSTCNVDFADRFAIDAAKTAIAKENLTGLPDGETVSTDSLDDCGLRFLLAMKHYNYLIKCLPLAQRAQFQKQGVSTNNLVWAFHSESEEELLGLIPSYAKGQPKWSILKELGVGWWIRSNIVLKKSIEKIAKAAFQLNQDPLDAAIYYLAMKKKNLVWGLFRNKRDERMTAFFSNNFTEDRWRKAALKNAYALLGKQRFDHAAAFFLLAGALRDAIDVCLNKLNDIQLAMIIARLYEDDMTSANLKRLLYEEILGCDENGNNPDINKAHPDPFLRSMALWLLKDYSGSLNTLLLTNVGTLHSQYNDESEKPEGATANPNVFNFYVYLRTHPLLIRQYIASTAQDKKKGMSSVVLSGFSYGTETKGQPDKQLLLEDSITPLERQLYFTTAHAHFKAGCPALALEVLSKLPNKVIDTSIDDSPSLLNSPSKTRPLDSQIDTGILGWDSEPNVKEINSSSSIDWGDSSTLDWSQPVTKKIDDDDDKFQIKWDDDDDDNNDDEDDDKHDSPPMSMKLDSSNAGDTKKDNNKNIINEKEEVTKPVGSLDIMAQQLKFVACLKILMEELSTLATGFEVDGGQLRYQLYVWLEREVDALRQLCSYSVNSDGDVINVTEYDSAIADDVAPYKPGEQPTLHEILVAEKFDFEAKVQRAARRKKWLKANETLLRTLLSYCSLHGASGGGLASVRMELVLLLQELQQEKTQQQLLSPLPFPTTLPLLSASVACNKTVVADPVRHLQSLAHDMLQTLVELRNTPTPNRNTHYCEVFIMRDLAVALSACIYQSLCDSDTFVMKHQQPDNFPAAVSEIESFSGGHLVASNRYGRRYSMDESISITTLPSKWPGVTNLRALLAREKDEDTPKLNILLCETFVATYMSLFVYALSSCDSHILYRLVGQKFDNNTWSCLFGGGVKKLVKIASSSSGGITTTTPTTTTRSSGPNISVERTDSISGDIQAAAGGVWNTITKQRNKLNMKLLGQFSTQQPSIKEDKPTYREQFVSPQMSMVSYFLMKPLIQSEYADEIDYDSSDSAISDLGSSDEEEDIFDTNIKPKNKPKDNIEHSNPNGYSWSIMRLAIVKILQKQLQDFLTVAGIEMQELPVSSPLIHGTLGIAAQWQETLKDELETKGPPPVNYIPGCTPDPIPTPGKPAIHKYRSLLEKGNTPFNTRLASAAPANRLWAYLVRQESVQDIFIRAVFGKRRSLSSILDNQMGIDSTTRGGGGTGEDKTSENGATTNIPEPVRIIHKEQDSISAFCLNQVNAGLMALATPREVQEMDISLLLELPSWLEDECEFDIINLNKSIDLEPVPPSSFLVIQTAADRPLLAQSPTSNSPQPQSGIASQSGRGASVMKGMPAFPGSHDLRFCQFVADRSKHLLKPILKHKIDGIRRVSAHPLLPLYLTGSQDGSVSLWEWGHQTAVATPRPAGTFAKVTRVRFAQHGNKFGVADSDGHLSLFQVACREGTARPFFNYQCHSKVTSDFVFLGACSLVATAGHGSEGRNVALWDTLLPQNKSLVQGFTCHDQGASSVILAPQHQLLISGGKKGDINIFDVRQRQQRHRFHAHDSAIKCLALDPHEEFFVSGAGDGDIKVWALTVHTLMYFFPGEHPRSSFFKNIGQGVTQLHVDSAGRLFSCGADGSMKVRQLPERDCVVQTI